MLSSKHLRAENNDEDAEMYGKLIYAYKMQNCFVHFSLPKNVMYKNEAQRRT